jgi:hydrogenase maturation protease
VAAAILILGYGNPLRADDGFGWEAARELAAKLEIPSVEVRALHQLTPELAEDVGAAGRVIFIDAASEGEPGALVRREVFPARQADFTHHLTPATLLALARQIYGRTPPALLYSVAGEFFGYREGLSPRVGGALADLLRILPAECGDVRS